MIIRTSRNLLCRVCRMHIAHVPSQRSFLSIQTAALLRGTDQKHRPIPQSLTHISANRTHRRTYASPTAADDQVEKLTDLYATARDEFEIAAEETEKKTVYAADDREAATAALKELRDGYSQAIKESSPEVGKEIQSRVGQRIRELESALKNLEESAMED